MIHDDDDDDGDDDDGDGVLMMVMMMMMVLLLLLLLWLYVYYPKISSLLGFIVYHVFIYIYFMFIIIIIIVVVYLYYLRIYKLILQYVSLHDVPPKTSSCKHRDTSHRFLATKTRRYPRSWWYFHKTLGYCTEFGLVGDCLCWHLLFGKLNKTCDKTPFWKVGEVAFSSLPKHWKHNRNGFFCLHFGEIRGNSMESMC